MRTLLRWIFRIALVLVIVGFLAAIAFLLLKDSLSKSFAERNLRQETGMDAKVGKLEWGLLTPTVNMEGLKMYNRPEFGGGVFLDMPELRIEYVPEQMRNGKVHLKTVRLHIAEVNVVKDKNGKTNLEAINKEASGKTGQQRKTGGSKTPGIDFGGIDVAYVTIGKVRVIDLGNPRNNREINVGMKEEVGRNLKTEAEVTAWLTFAVMKSLWRESAKPGSTQDLGNLLEMLVPKSSSGTRR